MDNACITSELDLIHRLRTGQKQMLHGFDLPDFNRKLLIFKGLVDLSTGPRLANNNNKIIISNIY